MADPAATRPSVIDQKGMGPGFWPLTVVLTILNVAVAFYIVYGNLDYLLPAWVNPVSDRAADVDDLMKFMGVFGFAIFTYVAGYVVYFAIVFRRRADEPATTVGVQIHDAPALEFWWTAIPTLLLVALVVLTIIVWQRIQFPKVAPALTMEVVAHQFDFEFRYPGLTSSLYSPKDEMHLPIGKQVSILISSSDVIHQFWVPEFRLKLAAVPGLVQPMNFTPTRPGKFDIVCSEYCGVFHSRMQGKVVVETPDQFDKWLADQKARAAAGAHVNLASGNAAAGKATFAQKCAACHAIAPFERKIVGPGLLRITDDPAHPKLVDGKPPTPGNIEEILDKGFTGPLGAMPNRQANGLSDQDIANLVAYLVSLK